MAYFKKLPDILYPTLKKERNSSLDYTKIKNLFKRAKLRDDFLSVYSAFEKYSIVGDDRPDNVAEQVYGDSGYDWVILITNNIQNVRNDWPMSQGDFNRYLTEKYTPEELNQVHHYETQEVRNSDGDIVIKKGLIVPLGFTMKYSDKGVTYTYSDIFSVTNFEHEVKLNEEKRNIVLIRQEFIRVVEKDLKRIMRYQNSSEYIDNKTIKTYNPRLS